MGYRLLSVLLCAQRRGHGHCLFYLAILDPKPKQQRILAEGRLTHGAGLVIGHNSAMFIPLEDEHEPLNSSQAFLWAVFTEEQEKCSLRVFLCSGQFWMRLIPTGCTWLLFESGLASHCHRIASSRRGFHRKVQSRSQSEQRFGFGRNLKAEVQVFLT